MAPRKASVNLLALDSCIIVANVTVAYIIIITGIIYSIICSEYVLSEGDQCVHACVGA